MIPMKLVAALHSAIHTSDDITTTVMPPGIQRIHRALETAAVGAILLAAFFLLKERIERIEFPFGDEGSWMSVASQLERGEGFTTRWYEHPFQKYPMLPRPDDFRYPALTLILAIAFKLFGTTYPTALWTVCVLYLTMLVLLYLTVRRVYGVAAALMTCALSAVSLLQLYWNGVVYSEGLFGIAIASVIIVSVFMHPDRIRSWVVLGVACGFIYYVRPNGILFLIGFFVHPVLKRKNAGIAIRQAVTGMIAFSVTVAPWLVRSWILFGNPFHIASGAGVLRVAPADPFTWTMLEFLSHYTPLIFLKGIVMGIIPFVQTLHFFEKNLFILPVAGIIISVIRRRPFYTPFIATGFISSLCACFYVAFTQPWAGVRYASSFLPFLYAYGIAGLVSLCDQATCRFPPGIRYLSRVILFLILLSPVYYPHRYYQRMFSKTPTHHLSFNEHIRILDSLVPAGGYYLADAYGQLAFLSNRNCAGIQGFFDSTMVAEYLQRYSPTILVLREHELGNPRIRSILREMGRRGYAAVEEERAQGGIYFRITRIAPVTGGAK